MADRNLVFYGSHRADRTGIRLVDDLHARLSASGAPPTLAPMSWTEAACQQLARVPPG